MTRKTYRGNLLWQSGLTLLVQSRRTREMGRVGAVARMRGVDALRAARLSAEDVRRLRQGREVPWRLPRGRARVRRLADRPRSSFRKERKAMNVIKGQGNC